VTSPLSLLATSETTRLRPVDITVLITDRNLNVVGDPITCWDTVDCTLRWNEPGSGQFTAPGYDWIREQVMPGNRVVVLRDGGIFTSGPIEKRMYERSDDGETSGVGKYTVDFADDLALVAGRITYPNPALAPSAQNVQSYTFTGNAETAMRNLVRLNAGPDALAARRVPRLVLGELRGIGGTAVVNTRFEPLGDALRSAAVAGGGLGFRTRQNPLPGTAEILFEVFAPADKTNEVRFGFSLGNLRYLSYEESAPTATAAITGGQGEAGDSYVIERTNAAAEAEWGRFETLVSQPGGNPLPELEQAGDEKLAEGGPTARLTSSAWDSEEQRYGVHYGMGDKVSIEVWPGYVVSDVVRLVHLQAWATAGELISPMVGSQEAIHDPEWIRQMRYIDRRVGRLERTVT
jgi:hypothetical protein